MVFILLLGFPSYFMAALKIFCYVYMDMVSENDMYFYCFMDWNFGYVSGYEPG